MHDNLLAQTGIRPTTLLRPKDPQAYAVLRTLGDECAPTPGCARPTVGVPPFPGRPAERPGTAEGRVSEAAAHLPLDGLELAACAGADHRSGPGRLTHTAWP